MTAQVPDELLLDGERWALLCTPLDSWLATRPDLPRFVPRHTANWRGYVAKWRVEDGWLHLVGVDATVELPDRQRAEVAGSEALGGQPLPVRADFVSDRLRIGRGKVVFHVHADFASRWEEEMELDIESGRVVDSRRFAPFGECGVAGIYRLDDDLDQSVSGGAFGQLLVGSAPDGHRVVAKVARRRGGGEDHTQILTRDGRLPVHKPAVAVRRGDDGVSVVAEADGEQLESVLRNEAAILERDGGRLLPRSFGLWRHEPSGLLTLVMERLDGARPQTPQDVVAVLAALADAVDRGTFDSHGDVKPEHVFIDAGRVRLCDPAPRFDEPGWRGFTRTYNPHAYSGAAADVAGCATLLRYLPDTTAGWRWSDAVLAGPQPPDWAYSHRRALEELQQELASTTPPPAGWTKPPIPDVTVF